MTVGTVLAGGPTAGSVRAVDAPQSCAPIRRRAPPHVPDDAGATDAARERYASARFCASATVPGQHADAGTFTRGVGDDFVALEQNPKSKIPEDHEQEQWQRQGQLDDGLAILTTPTDIHRRHSVHTNPIVIGTA